MRHFPLQLPHVAAWTLVALALPSPIFAQDDEQNQDQDQPAAVRLKYVGAVTRGELMNVTGVDVSADGRFLYAAAYNANSVNVFSRDAKTGGLTLIQTIRDDDALNAAVSVQLSPDGKYAAAASFRADSVALFARDAKTGLLKMLDAKRQSDSDEFALDFAIDAAWSPDSRFVYAIAPSSSALNVFGVSDDGLEFIEAQKADGQCLAGARGVALDPKGQCVYVAAERHGNLTAFTRDPKTGKTTLLQVLSDGADQVETLAGAFSVATSTDGKFVYVSSGRFRGDDAVTVFSRDQAGKLTLVQQLVNQTAEMGNFVGGNQITIAPDGRTAYAVASKSDTLSVFRRDPKTGQLAQTQILVGSAGGVGPLGTASGVVVSPDGRFVYVAAETDNAVSIFSTDSPQAAEESVEPGE